VLGAAGHSDNGKANSTYQSMWISLARRGYVVLAWDPPGQGERLEYFDPDLGDSRVGTGTREHIMAGVQCLLTGGAIGRYFIWDGMRALDYLLTRQEVDPRRIAVAGNSGGGTQAAYLALFDTRLAAAVSSCYITSWKQLFDKPGPQDAEQIFPGFLRDGFDFVVFPGTFAPKPFLITSAVEDFFPIAGARATFEAAREIYKVLDAPGRVSFFEYEDTHGWSRPRREAAYRFLDLHLKGDENAMPEEPVETEPESHLWVTPTGQLATSFGTGTVFSLNRARAVAMYGRRRSLSLKQPDELRQLVRQRLVLPAVANVARQIPPGKKPVVIAGGLPKAEQDELTNAGFLVRPLPGRGFARGESGYTAAYQAAAREWLYGRSLLGARVSEFLAAISEMSVAPEADPRRILLWGRANDGVAAMIAAALDSRASRVLAESSITSWFAVTQSRLHRDMEELIVPGVLEDFDLPDLVQLIAPRPLWLADTRMPSGGRLLPGAAYTEYPRETVRVVGRPEGWSAIKTYREWLGLD
jgi:cephalosporin-C deacetylase-like acetyl esterase